MAITHQAPGFLPSTSGLRFPNHFPPGAKYPVVTLPVVGTVVSQDATTGLCGGFVFTVLDLFLHAPRFAPTPTHTVPGNGAPLFDYLTARLLDSLTVSNVSKAIDWIQRPDHDTILTTGLASLVINSEWPRIKQDIDAGRPSPLILVPEPYCGPLDIPGIKVALSRSHQVLAYAYALDDQHNLTLGVYDPNDPGDDASTIQLNIGNPTHTTPITATQIEAHIGDPAPIRGFFRADYAPKAPVAEARWNPPGDYNGDGRTDFPTYDPATGVWKPYINNPGGNAGYTWATWGGGTHDVPMVGDFNGDGRADFCIYDAAGGVWKPYINNPGGNAGYTWATWGGGPHDIAIPGDFNGDGKADFCIYDAAAGVWKPYINNPGGDAGFPWTTLGGPGWVPVPADYNGDGRTEPAVWNPETGEWRVADPSSPGGVRSVAWGNPRTLPMPGDYNGDGRADFCTFDPRSGVWAPLLNNPGGNAPYAGATWGGPGYVPISGDFNGDGRLDFGIHDPISGEWRPYLNNPGGSAGYAWATWGGSGQMPVATPFHPLWRQRFLTPALLAWPRPLQATNLLTDAGFEQASAAWRPVNLAMAVSLQWVTDPTRAKSGNGLLRVTVNQPNGSVAQDVNAPVLSGHSYRYTLWVRAASGGAAVPGRLALWALAGAQGESATTAFTASGEWQPVSVTLGLQGSDHRGVRAELYLSAPGTVEIDGAQVIDSGLVDAGFEQSSAAWRPVNNAAAVQLAWVGTTDAKDGGGVLQVTVTQADGSVAQDTSVLPAVGTTYAYTVWLRAAANGAQVTGRLAMWALDGPPESAMTPFTVGHSWTPVRVALDVQQNGHTGLRAELYVASPNQALQLDAAALLPAGLANAGFERASIAWRPFNLAGAVTAQWRTDPGLAFDGTGFVRLATNQANGSLAQDVGRPLSGVTYTFSVWLRAAPGSGSPVAGSLALWGLDGTGESGHTAFSVGPTWTLVTISLDVQHDDHTGLRAEIYLIDTHNSLDADGAALSGANPAVLATP